MSYKEAIKACRSWIKDHLPWEFSCISTEEEFDRGEWMLFYNSEFSLTLSIEFREDSVGNWQLEDE